MTQEQLNNFTQLVQFGRQEYISVKNIAPNYLYISTKVMDYFNLKFPLRVCDCQIAHNPFIAENQIVFSHQMGISVDV